MCFRPTTLSKPIKCPQCGKRVNALNGILPPKCPFCGFAGEVKPEKPKE